MIIFRIALILLLSITSALAEPRIFNPSFEEENIANQVGTEELVANPQLAEEIEKQWRTAIWGVAEPDQTACSFVSIPDAPEGKRVGQIHNKNNQICAFAQHILSSDLVPGQWYEVSCKMRCENTIGQGCFLNIEFWDHGMGCGGVDSEHLVGTVGWREAKVQFLAPHTRYHLNVSLWAFGGPGKVQFDDLKIRPISQPNFDHSQRRIVPGKFWGMFTCFANYLHQYGKDMKKAGVYWQRQGLSCLAAEQQKFMEENDMVFEACIDGLSSPGPEDKDDPCYPIANSEVTRKHIEGIVPKFGPSIRILEVINEANAVLSWNLPAYANVLQVVGSTLKSYRPDILFATGGFASPYIGYAEACLKRDPEKLIDIVLAHPYAVDEALDSQLFALADACERAGRREIALAINETGWPSWDPATGHPVNSWFVSEKEQAANVVKLHIQALAHKMSFVCYLNWNDFAHPQSDQSMNMGLVRVDGSPKPSFYAYTFMTGIIGDRRIYDWSYDDQGTRIYQLGQPDGEPVWVLWNALRDSKIIVDVGERKVFLCDMYGAKLTVTPETGKIELDVSNEPIYLVSAE